ncbi:hypothetical protein GC722_13150 [Auraticoccus sp. F435]|uniref:Uncharacterized protein n=1 Tax=Auraticoccus cholistanensis TaxID=2656650 RepID=A0A6A9UYL5_9ACTN|nr:hypothetical protein [Auraticoccus cholistanensis]MVA76962.1 hypothetical protein [Auraticoccus cholistanensis]
MTTPTHPAPARPTLAPRPPDDISQLLWEPITDWEYRPDPVGFDEDEDSIDHWVYVVDPRDDD